MDTADPIVPTRERPLPRRRLAVATAVLSAALVVAFGLYGNVAYDLELGREGEPIHSISLGADWKF